MPSYNHEKFISIPIESVLNQTVTYFEVIIIGDASKDKSKEIKVIEQNSHAHISS